MDKSNTNSEKIFSNNNEDFKIKISQNKNTAIKIPQIKISDLSIILYLHHCSEVIIRQYSNVKSWKCTVNHWERMIK